MKFILIILIFFSLNISAQTVYYVGTTGDDSRTALQAQSPITPWRTVGHAINTVPVNSTVRVGAGTFNEAGRLNFLNQVNLEGVDSNSTKLVVTYYDSTANDAALLLSSIQTPEDTLNGNQFIRNLWLDGNHISYGGILVKCRSNVIITGIKATGFRGFWANLSGAATSGAPVNKAVNNEIAYCSVTDCSIRDTTGLQGSGANIFLKAQKNVYIHDNHFRAYGLLPGQNNDIIGAVGGYNEGLRFYNNVCIKPPTNGTQFNFIIESWKENGGNEISYNTFIGGNNQIDWGTGGSVKGPYAYSVRVHHNIFKVLSQYPTAPARLSIGFQTEDAVSDYIIDSNYFLNLEVGIRLSLTHSGSDINQRGRISNNLFENIGLGNNAFGSFIIDFGGGLGTAFRDININNNTMISGGGKSRAGIHLDAQKVPIQNIQIVNNIVQGVSPYGWLTFDGAMPISNVTCQNNITWLNSFTNNPYTRVLNITAGAFVVGGRYTISSVGSTNFTAIGAGSNTVGVVFTATGAGAGTGTANTNPLITNFTNTGIIVSDPLFISTTDFHLQPSSPAIGTGQSPPNNYRGYTAGPTSNIPPIVNAGTGKNITLPTNSVSQAGSASDPDGSVVSYLWTLFSGPATYTIVSPTAATTTISNLVAGNYVFQLVATDNAGATGSDTVSIVVNAAVPVNIPPIANAGGNKNITLPTATVTQVGSGTDADGSIVSYAWTKTSGPVTYNIVSPTSATTVINNLTTPGTYGFTLTVTDNLGATGSATATIIVNAAANVSPTANAGADQVITFPVVSATLTGSGNDPDGSIVSYAWTKAPTQGGVITSPNSATTTVTGLKSGGVYQFRLTVVDNLGGTGTDVMQVTVNKGAASGSFINLSQAFTGSALQPGLTTTPAGLSYSITLDGVTGGKINPNTYAAVGNVTDTNYISTPVSATFTITKATAVLSASNSTVNFDNLTHSVSATTTPAGLTGVTATYTGISGTVYPTSATPPSAIGQYRVDFILSNSNYQATPISVTLTIVNNAAIIFISDSLFTYDANPHGVTVTTAYTYDVTYNGSGSVPFLAGSYIVIAHIIDGIHTGADTATLVILKAGETITWNPLSPVPAGSLIGPAQLNASSDIAGTITYSYPPGPLPLGSTTITLTFTPTDAVNYNSKIVTNVINAFGTSPFLNYFISGPDGRFFFVEQ